MRTQVLIVDDDPLAIEVMSANLAGDGYLIDSAREWSEMNRRLLGKDVAVLILDINLPGLKGDTLAEIVHKNLSLPPSIVLHSGIEINELRRLTRKVRATNCIPKGMPADECRKIVKAAAAEFLQRKQAQDSARQTHPPPPPRSS